MSAALDKLLDKTKIVAFNDSNSAFLAVILCNLNISWSEEVPTAYTNGKFLKINPKFFESLNQQTREFLLLHELWHVARAHPLRGVGKTNVEAWQYACDIVINNDLIRSGYSFTGVNPLVDLDYPDGTSEEEIYEKFKDSDTDIPEGLSDLEYLNSEDKQEVVEILMRAKELSRNKLTGSFASQFEDIIKGILPPKISWKTLLNDFVSLAEVSYYSLSKRNKRFPSIYMPSQIKEETLPTINYYIDVSGSVTDAQIRRFNSELHYLMQTYSLDKLNIIQFDTSITKETEVTSLNIPQIVVGRGGTSLECVKKHIEKTKPEFVIIFSDLECDPMETLNYQPKLLWIIIDNVNVIPPFGKYAYVTN